MLLMSLERLSANPDLLFTKLPLRLLEKEDSAHKPPIQPFLPPSLPPEAGDINQYLNMKTSLIYPFH